jgi:hypothetical protein
MTSDFDKTLRLRVTLDFVIENSNGDFKLDFVEIIFDEQVAFITNSTQISTLSLPNQLHPTLTGFFHEVFGIFFQPFHFFEEK